MSDAAPEKLTRAEKKALKKEKIRKKRADRNRVVRLFPVNKKGYHIVPFFSFLRAILCPIHKLFYPYRLHGNTKVGQGAYLFFGNHYCLWDIFYPARVTKESIHYLTKQTVLEAPILNWWGMKIGAIGAMRDGSDVRTLMESMKVLKHGDKVSMFPEGTRNKTEGDEFLPFKGGAALIAIKTKTPVIPFVLCNRPRLFHKTHIVFGDPLELTDYYDRKLTSEDYAAADEMLKNRLYEMRAEFRAMQQEKRKKKKKGDA